MKRTLSVVPLAALVFGCSGEGNTGQPNRDFTWDENGTQVSLWDEVPWANHATPQFIVHADRSRGEVEISSGPVYPPISSNTPDPGSRPVDCSALDGIEVSPYYVDTFEPPLATNAAGQSLTGVATAWSSYDDGSDTAFRVPGDVGWYPDLGGSYIDEAHTQQAQQGILPPYARAGSSPWGLAADHQFGERPTCDGAPNDWVLHYKGGRFNYYGGGMAHPFSPPLDLGLVYGPEEHAWIFHEICPPGSDLCPHSRRGDDPQLALDDVFPTPPGGYMQTRPGFWDASLYDGVVFWARRGPDSATGLLVALQDKYTSDDLARENERYCKRIKVCVPQCVNGFSCVRDTAGEEKVKRCMPASTTDATIGDYNVAKVSNPALREFLFPRCQEDTCVPAKYYPDYDLNETTCNAFAFTGNDEGYWCSNPNKPVAPYAERCGDAFVSAISLSTDWKLFKIPFDSFRQVGFGKPAPSFDLKTLYSIAFQFTVGYADVYVDNVSFYRNK